MDPSLPARFWSKVDRNGPVQDHMDTRCWSWTGYIGNSGPDRWKERSRTFEGVAKAMGEQWGNRQLPVCEEQLSLLAS